MSRNRNRSVKTLPHAFENILVKFCDGENRIRRNLDYFGENVQDNIDISPEYSSNLQPRKYSSIYSSDAETTDSITLDLNKLSGLSSSSSLSWSDEYESDITKKVQEELEKIDRVLRGDEPIPPNYDKEEFEEWMGTFPNISIFDSEVTPVNSTQNIFESVLNEEEKNTVGERVNFINKDCDICTCNNKTTLTVIDISSSSMKMPNQRSANTARKRKLEENKGRNRNIFTISHKPKSLDTDKYLKISSLKSQVYDRKLSSRSLVNAIDHKEEGTQDYISLPCIKIEDSDISRRNTRLCTQNCRNLKHEILHKKNETNLVLPPILTTNQFRSVSATPRPTNKTFSALSMKLNSHFKDSKSRKSSIFFLENPISNR